jgi:hypothetical protein
MKLFLSLLIAASCFAQDSPHGKWGVGIIDHEKRAAIRDDEKTAALSDDEKAARIRLLSIKNMPAFFYVSGDKVIGMEYETQVGDSSQAAFDALFSLFAKVSKSEENGCRATTWTNYDPGVKGYSFSVAGVQWRCGPGYGIRLVRMSFTQGPTFYSVGEDIGVTQ